MIRRQSAAAVAVHVSSSPSLVTIVHEDYVKDGKRVADAVSSESLEAAARKVLTEQTVPHASIQRTLQMGTLPSTFLDAVEAALGLAGDGAQGAVRARREELVAIVARLMVTKQAAAIEQEDEAIAEADAFEAQEVADADVEA